MPTSSQRMELACPAGTGGKLKATPGVIGQRRHCEARRCEGGQVAQQARGHRIAVASTYKDASARFAGVAAMSPSTDATSRGGRIRAPSNGGRNQAHQLAPHGLPRLRQPGRPTTTVAPAASDRAGGRAGSQRPPPGPECGCGTQPSLGSMWSNTKQRWVTSRTGASTGPVARAVAASRIRKQVHVQKPCTLLVYITEAGHERREVLSPHPNALPHTCLCHFHAKQWCSREKTEI